MSHQPIILVIYFRFSVNDNTQEYLAHISNFLCPCNQLRLLTTIFIRRKQTAAGKKKAKRNMKKNKI